MAKPIQLDTPTRDHRAELQRRLADAPIEHAAAILELLELLEVLHERNVLNTLRGAVGAGETILGQLAQGMAKPEAVRALRNLIVLGKILGEIDPELLAAIQRSIPEELKDSSLRRSSPAPSLWKVAATLLSKPVRRTLVATGFVLAGVGYYLNRESANTTQRV